MEVIPNEHAKAIVSLRIKNDDNPENVIKLLEDKKIIIKSTEKGNSRELFKGYASSCEINTRKSSGVVDIELVSTTIKMDEEYKYVSYQEKDKTYKDIITVWKEYGFGTLLGGYLKLINPEDYTNRK